MSSTASGLQVAQPSDHGSNLEQFQVWYRGLGRAKSGIEGRSVPRIVKRVGACQEWYRGWGRAKSGSEGGIVPRVVQRVGACQN